MRMRVRFPGWIRRAVFVTMMLVVNVQVIVLRLFVPVLMAVPLAKQDCDPERHRRHGQDIEGAKAFAHADGRGEGSHEWSGREVRGFASRTDPSQRVRVEQNAQSISQAAE